MNVYREALKAGVTFQTNKGTVGLTDLFSLPLTSQRGISLDSLYSDTITNREKLNTNSYIQGVNNAELALCNLKLELLKDVMDTKIAESEQRKAAQDAKSELSALLAEKANRIASAPAKLADDALEKRIAELTKQL